MQKQIVVDCPSGVISKEAARSIARDIIEFFQNPDNVKGFEEWKKLNNATQNQRIQIRFIFAT